MDKRILVHGEGGLGDATFDQRANSPAFRIRRAAVLRNVDVDMTGFREAVLVEGPASLRPLIDACTVRCPACTSQDLTSSKGMVGLDRILVSGSFTMKNTETISGCFEREIPCCAY